MTTNSEKPLDFFSAVMKWREEYSGELAAEDPNFDPFVELRDRKTSSELPVVSSLGTSRAVLAK